MNLRDWNLPPKKVVSICDRIHIWLCSIDISEQDISGLKNILSSDELEKANKFHFLKDKNSFIISRGSLKIILSRYINTSPQNINFSYNKYGKPFLLNPLNSEISFNLSHSGNFCLIGVAKNDKIGVDIEKINKDFSSLEIAKKYFSKKEYFELSKLSKDERTKAFYYCWTRKEAYIKAEGKGLSIDLDSFDVTISEKEPKIIRINNDLNITNWQLYNIHVNDEYCAAVASFGKEKKMIKTYIQNIILV